MKQRKCSITHDDFLHSNEYDAEDLINYWKDNQHVYVCSSKVGSTVIRSVLMDNLNIPFIHKKQNHLMIAQKKHQKEFTSSSYEGPDELSKRNILFLVRCPFHRVVSSYEYRTDVRFIRDKDKYLSHGIDIDNMNIIEYINFLRGEIQKHNYNSTIEHFLPQKQSFHVSAFEGTKIKVLWQTEKIDELLDLWNKAFELTLNVNQKKNRNIKNPKKYYHYYVKYPQLFELVQEAFREDLDWLNPIFGYEKKFKKALNDFRMQNHPQKMEATEGVRDFLNRIGLKQRAYSLKQWMAAVFKMDS